MKRGKPTVRSMPNTDERALLVRALHALVWTEREQLLTFARSSIVIGHTSGEAQYFEGTWADLVAFDEAGRFGGKPWHSIEAIKRLELQCKAIAAKLGEVF